MPLWERDFWDGTWQRWVRADSAVVEALRVLLPEGDVLLLIEADQHMHRQYTMARQHPPHTDNPVMPEPPPWQPQSRPASIHRLHFFESDNGGEDEN
jgi:hypothetical protein